MSQCPDECIEPVGLVGLGLMGRGIATCLIARGLKVIAYNRTASRAGAAARQIRRNVEELIERKVMPRSKLRGWEKRLKVTGSLGDLAGCPFIIESVKEDLALKRAIFDELEEVIPPEAIVASNTSGFLVKLLGKGRKHPGRFLVMHWCEPAWITRYMEIVPGEQTCPRAQRLALKLALAAGKEPSLAKMDVRGFISNRMMYAVMREACHMVEMGIADVETVDRSFRNDIGTWATLAGPFRWMDLTGIGAYATVMEGLLPDLSDRKTVPEMMKKIVASGAEGISNAKGFYEYTKAGAREWEKAWTDFNYDVQKLVAKYAERVKL